MVSRSRKIFSKRRHSASRIIAAHSTIARRARVWLSLRTSTGSDESSAACAISALVRLKASTPEANSRNTASGVRPPQHFGQVAALQLSYVQFDVPASPVKRQDIGGRAGPGIQQCDHQPKFSVPVSLASKQASDDANLQVRRLPPQQLRKVGVFPPGALPQLQVVAATEALAAQTPGLPRRQPKQPVRAKPDQTRKNYVREQTGIPDQQATGADVAQQTIQQAALGPDER